MKLNAARPITISSLASFLWVSIFLATSSQINAADEFQDRIRPFAKKYCAECHNSKKANADLDFTHYTSGADVVRDFRHWINVIEFIQGGEMPPPEEKNQPTIGEREQVVASIKTLLSVAAQKNAGDPGEILPRRLSNTEYDLSVRDLTGVDVKATANFPADPAGGEGFDNTGEALSMSPNLLKKYLSAGQQVASHLVLKTDGITFSPFPVTSYNERKKLTEQAIIDFYHAHDVQTIDYLAAAWRFRYRVDEDREITIEHWAQRHGLSKKYLATIFATLQEAPAASGYLKQLGEKWLAVPPPTEDGQRPRQLIEVERYIQFCKSQFYDLNQNLIRANAGTWPIGQLDFRAKTAALRDRCNNDRMTSQFSLRFDRLRSPQDEKDARDVSLFIRIEPAVDGAQDNYVVLHRPVFSKNGSPPRNAEEEKKHEVVSLKQFLTQHAPSISKSLSFGVHPKGSSLDAESIALKAPANIEIKLTPEMLKQLNDKHLLMKCELDPEHGREGSVYIQYSIDKPLDDKYGNNVQLLIYRDSKLAAGISASNEQFCHAFPSQFFYVHKERGLAAGFHLVEGFFRDDQPLVQKVLDDSEINELNQLWEELDFVTQSAETLIRGFVWFERSERHVLHDERFDFLRPEDPKLVEEEMLTRFEKVYLGKMGVKLVEDSSKPNLIKPESPSDKYDMIHGFFEQIRHGLAHRQKLMKHAEQSALRDFELLAKRAYRRSLQPRETESLRKLYQRLRDQGQDVEGSLRGVLTAVLMSPDFCYRYTESPKGSNAVALSNQALASRLSYFLWSSIPDDELLAVAEQGKLTSDEALQSQTRRMMKDPRINAFAREFLGQWLRYRDYLAKDPINAEAFRGYDDPLRQAMFEEPIQVATDLIQNDKPITDLLTTDSTFVNGTLANHYGGEIAARYRTELSKWTNDVKRRGLPVPKSPEMTWHKVTGLREVGRGGLFGMGVILTKNSAGERTSPVKRGFWAVHHLLGKHFPPPPADVPELPPGEKEATKTIRELIAEHTAHTKCAICHTHFDSVGLAMEGFDPIGRARTKDLAGRTIDNVATLPNGETAKGIPGLIDYIDKHRKQDFVRTMSRKFLGYALGRSVVLSDQPLLDKMESELEKNNYRFSIMFETVIKSPQFRKQRGKQFVAARN